MNRNTILVFFTILMVGLFSFVKISSKEIIVKEAYKNSHLASKYNGGPPANKTGAPGEGKCTDCHSGTATLNSNKNTLSLFLEGTNTQVTDYEPGTVYDVVVSINDAATRKGFQTTARIVSNNTTAGNLVATAGSTALLNSSGKQFINHTSTSTTSGIPFTFKWTAPSSDQGDVRFYIASNITNNSGTNSGDQIHLSEHTFAPAPIAPPVASFTSSSSVICSGESVTFTNTSTGNPTSFLWTIENGGTPVTSILESPTIPFTLPGIYNVTLNVTNSGGTNSSTSTITVNEGATISLGTLTNATICGANDGTIQVLGSGTGNVVWSGSATGNLNTTLPAILTGFSAGNYILNFDNGSNCPTNQINATITDPNAPTPPTITSTDADNIICTGSTVTLTSSQTTGITWSSGEQTATIEITTAGDYFVTYVENGCSSSSEVQSVSFVSCASLQENTTNELKLFPNPSNGSITINSNLLVNFSEYEIKNELGQLELKNQLHNSVISIDVTYLKKGIYFITLINSTEKIQKRFVIE